MSSENILLEFFLKIIFITSMDHSLIQPDTALFEDICVDNFQVETRTQVEACGQQTSDHEII